MCRVAVESLAGRGAVEVGVAQQSSLARRVAQTILCLYVCTWTEMKERHRGEKERDGEREKLMRRWEGSGKDLVRIW